MAGNNAAASSNTPKTSGKGQKLTIASQPRDEFSDYLFISQLYSQANRGKEAIAAANQAAAIAVGAELRQIAKLTLATAQQTDGDFAAAEATLREILRESPDNPIALNNLGYFLLERNERLEEALELIKKAVASDPTNPSFLDSLGWAHFKLGNLEEAEKYLRDAIAFDSSSATIHEHLGDVLEKQGKSPQAKMHWQRALELSTDASSIGRLRAKLK
jgi:tetratricopeptide (TPR) repeat protein